MMIQIAAMAALVLLLFAPLPQQAAVRTVCMAGCDYTSILSALNQAKDDPSIDVIEVKAGETFNEYVLLPPRIASEHWITIRSTRWRELPPAGYRVNPSEHAALMPTIMWSGGPHPVRAVQPRATVTANETADTLRIASGDNPPVNGQLLRCTSSGTLPVPLVSQGSYFVVNRSGTDFQLAAAANGAPIDLASEGSGTIQCSGITPAAYYRFEGIQVRLSTTFGNPHALIWLGYDEHLPEALPHHLEFRHMIVRGEPSYFKGPVHGILATARHLTIEDSWIGDCKMEGIESHAIALLDSPGPTLIKNNYLAAASIGILTGGGAPSAWGQPASDVQIVGNHIHKPGEFLYNEGNGPPAGACLPGRFYRDRTASPNTCAGGACWVCQADGAWTMDTETTYRNYNLNTKGGVEFKGCLRCQVEGNVIENTFDGHDAGNTTCFAFVQGQTYQPQKQILFKNNWCKNTWSGVAAAHVLSGALMTDPDDQLQFVNNLMTGLGNHPAYSIHPAPAAFVTGAKLYDGRRNLVFDHNTVRATGAVNFAFGLVGVVEERQMDGFRLTNNMFPRGTYGIFMDGTDGTCGVQGMARYMRLSGPPYPIHNNVLYGMPTDPILPSCTSNLATAAGMDFAGDNDHRLTAGSPFSASCTSGCRFAATDGKDMGADVEELEAAISGAVAGTPPVDELFGLAVDAGSTKAVFRYKPPDAASCRVQLYTNAARTALAADTDTEEAQADGRAGNISGPERREFVLGTRAALSPETSYYYRLSCGSRKTVGSFRTQASQAAPRRYAYDWPTARTAEYSTQPDMSGAVTLPAATRHEFEVPGGQLLYVRFSGGPITVLVAP